MRGGEKVLLSLATLFPDAPIFTLLHVPGSVSPELEARDIRTTFVQRLPDVARRYRHYLPLFPAAARSIDVSGFDLVISSSHCVVKSVRVRPGALHLCYCHTPMRYVWDRYDDYFGPGRVSWPASWLIPGIAAWLRRWDAATAHRVDRYIANSAYVAGRIERYYGRDAQVIPPPADTDFFTPDPSAGRDYDLVVSALAPYKRIDLILAAYRGTGRRLLVVGTGPDEDRLRSSAPDEASFLGAVDDAELRRLYRGCRVVVNAAVEDFGIVPVEAAACARPAIVFGEGGAPETVIEGETGLVFKEASAEALRAAVNSLDSVQFRDERLREWAEAHSRARFEARLDSFVQEALAESEAAGGPPPVSRRSK